MSKLGEGGGGGNWEKIQKNSSFFRDTFTNIANNDDINNIDHNRERYVSGVCALDLVNEISQETLVRVLRLMI